MPLDALLLFIAAGLLLNLTPGPDVLFIVSSALQDGVRAGVVAALGITAGCFVHIFAAAAGISALMVASTTAFSVLKWMGAAYLIYSGVRLLLNSRNAAMNFEAPDAVVASAGAKKDYKSVFYFGFWTNALNPKVALFFLAFLPQFIAPTVENKPLAFLMLGLLFTFSGLWVNLGWAAASAWLARRASRAAAPRGGLFRWLDRLAATMFVGFGIKLALTQAPNP